MIESEKSENYRMIIETMSLEVYSCFIKYIGYWHVVSRFKYSHFCSDTYIQPRESNTPLWPISLAPLHPTQVDFNPTNKAVTWTQSMGQNKEN